MDQQQKYFIIPGFLLILTLVLAYNVTGITVLSLILAYILVVNLITKFGKKILIEDIALFFLALQYILAPFFAYKTYNNNFDFSTMVLPEGEYFQYIFLSVAAFWAGIKLIKPKTFLLSYFLEKMKNNQYRNKNGEIGLYLVLMGFGAKFIIPFIPLMFGNVFYLLSSIRFIGLIYLYFSNHKYRKLIIVLVFLEFAINIILGSVFYELLMWLALFFSFILLDQSFSTRKKIAYVGIALFLLMTLQSAKSEYRRVMHTYQNDTEKVWVFSVLYLEHALTFSGDDAREIPQEGEGAFKNLVNRLNLGWVITNIIEHDSYTHFEHGGKKLLRDLPSIILPRFLYPEKKTISGADLSEEFQKYTGKYLPIGATINLSAIGDAYINFGFYGSILFMFLFGMMVKGLINLFLNLYATYPTIIFWMPMIFFDFIRMNDFYTSFNSLFKNSLLILFLFFVFRERIFYRTFEEEGKEKSREG